MKKIWTASWNFFLLLLFAFWGGLPSERWPCSTQLSLSCSTPVDCGTVKFSSQAVTVEGLEQQTCQISRDHSLAEECCALTLWVPDISGSPVVDHLAPRRLQSPGPERKFEATRLRGLCFRLVGGDTCMNKHLNFCYHTWAPFCCKSTNQNIQAVAAFILTDTACIALPVVSAENGETATFL